MKFFTVRGLDVFKMAIAVCHLNVIKLFLCCVQYSLA
jgi:hypothetical protein